MNSFQDPIVTDPFEYSANSIGTYETSSFQDLLSRPQTESIRTCNMTRQGQFKGNGSFQDLLSRPLHMNRVKTLNNENSLVILDQQLAEGTQLEAQSTEAPQEDIATEYQTHFKTLHINGI